MKKIVISHFHNEEILMPLWLEHHVPLFDHGVLLDHHSTDSTVSIVREMAPHWEVRKTALEYFDARRTDQEVMEVEREFTGWKIALNTTEFLLMKDLGGQLAKHEEDGVRCLAIDPAVMIDPVDKQWNTLRPGQPITSQCHHGFIDRGYTMRSRRFLHCHEDGGYGVGRHSSIHESVLDPRNLVCWLAFVAFEQLLQRKMQIQGRIPGSDRAAGLGVHHFFDEGSLRNRYLGLAAGTRDLMDDETFRAMVID